MSTVDATATLAELVTANPALAAPLDRLGLDYCCGGRHRLIDAVDTAGLHLDEVLDTLAAVGAPGPEVADLAAMGAAELVDHVEASHHVYLREALPRLDALMAKVAAVHGERHPELAGVQALFGELRADLEPHLLDEERTLFPMIRSLAGVAGAPRFHSDLVTEPVRMLLAEHDVVGGLLARLRVASGGFAVPDDGCASYRALYTGLAELEADTHLHVHKENNLLFPAVLAAGVSLPGPNGPSTEGDGPGGDPACWAHRFS